MQQDYHEMSKEFLVNCWQQYLRAYELTILQVINLKDSSAQCVEEEFQLPVSLAEYLEHCTQKTQSEEVVMKIGRDDLPLQTTYYIPLNTNIRIVNPTPLLYDNLTPYSVYSDPSSVNQKIAQSIKDQFDKVQLRNQKCLNFYEENFVKLMFKSLLSKFNAIQGIKMIKEIASLLKKDPRQMVNRFAEELRNVRLQVESKSNKHFFYGSCDHFCNICLIYQCSTHFPIGNVKLMNELYQTEDNDRLLDNPAADNKYEIRAKPNLEQLIMISKTKVNDSQFVCQDTQKCYKTSKQPNSVKLKKFQKHWVDMLCGYGIKNTCLITKALQHPNYTVTCGDVGQFMASNKELTKPFAERSLGQPLNKKRIATNQGQLRNPLRDDIIAPCFHDATCGTNECHCDRCYKYCCCPPTCAKRIFCNCKDCNLFENGRFVCPCKTARVECDSDICGCPIKVQKLLTSMPRSQSVLSCPNSPITYSVRPRLVLSKSLVCEGLGVFAGQDFAKCDFVGEYRGVILDETQSDIVESLDQITGQHYLFVLNSEEQVDGKKMGNKTRFVNHALPPVSNCDCSVVVVKGLYKVQMFAKRPILIGEELYFDYSEEFKTEWKIGFDKRSKEYFKQVMRHQRKQN